MLTVASELTSFDAFDRFYIYHILFRNMLSCAHILAMDTKNLLDVCDSIRARYPEFKFNQLEQVPPQSSSPSLPHNLPHASPKRQPRPPIVQEFYQNVAANANSSDRLDLVGNNEQIYCNQVLPSEIGIYDNQAAIQEHSLRIVESESNSSSQKILSA